MSDRNLPTQETAMRDTIRDLRDRLQKLERGGVFNGIISFGPHIQIGDASITVLPDPGNLPDGRILTFKNVLTGAVHTITL